MKYLIVGLGNKGPEYAETRHNIGFKIVDALANTFEQDFKTCNFGLMSKCKYKGRSLMVLKPDTYMNLSGNAIKFWMEKEKIPLQNLLIITDDLHLKFGTLRMKLKGSNAGHNGLKSIEECLQTQEYTRLRFGISANFSDGKQVDYVLGKWNEEELKSLDDRINIFVKSVLSFCFAGVQNTMTDFNGK